MIDKALGGVAIHSCGRWNNIIPRVLELEGLLNVELALDKKDDPSPSIPEEIREGFKGSGIPIKARMGLNFMDIIERVYDKDLILVPQIGWVDGARERDNNYERFHSKIEELSCN